MTASDVQIQIIGRDMASQAFKQVNQEAQATAARLDSFSNTISGINSAMSNMVGFTLATAEIMGVSSALHAAVSDAKEFYTTMETGSISLAGSLISMTNLNGETESWSQALQISKGLMQQLNDQALITGASTKEITDVFRSMIAPAMNAGMTIKQTLDLASTLTTTGKAMGLQESVLRRDVADMITGRNLQRTKLGSLLGITDADIAEAKTSVNGLYDFLTKRLQGEKEANENYLKSFEGRMNHMKEAIGRVMGTSFAPTMAGATSAMSDIADKFVHVETDASGAVKKDEKGNPKITMDPEMVHNLMTLQNYGALFLDQMKEVGKETSIVVVPAVKLIGSGLAFAATNAEKLINGAVILGGLYYSLTKGSSIVQEFNAAFNNVGTAQTKLGKLIQAEYAKDALAAQESAAVQMAAENEVTALRAKSAQQRAALSMAEKKAETAEAMAQATVTSTIAKEQMAQQNLLLAQRSENTAKIGVMQANLEKATLNRSIAEEKLSTMQQVNSEKIVGLTTIVTESQERLNLAIEKTNILKGEEGAIAAGTAASEVRGTAVATVAQNSLAGATVRGTVGLIEMGAAGAVSGVKVVGGAVAGAGAVNIMSASAMRASGAITSVGVAATTAGVTTVTQMGSATGAISKVTKALWMMAGGWAGVVMAIGMASVAVYDYFEANARVKGYDKKADIKYDPAGGGKYFKKVAKTPEDYAEEIKNGDTGTSLSLPWKWIELSPKEYQAQYIYDKKHELDGDPEAQAEQQQKQLEDQQKKLQEELDAKFAAITGKYAGQDTEKKAHKKDYTNKEKAFEFFTGHGFTPEQAAGIVGHLMVESGGSGDLDPTVTASDGAFGIAQWTDTPRVERMNNYMKERGLDKNNLYSQLNFMMEEFKTTEADAYDKIVKAKTVDDAVNAAYYYERPEDWHNEARTNRAYEMYKKYGEDNDSSSDKSVNERVKKFDEAKKSLEKLMNSIQAKTLEASGTNYEAAMAKFEADFKEKTLALRDIHLKAPTLDITEAQKALDVYKKAEIDKYVEKWTLALNGFKNEEMSVRAQITGNKSQIIDAEYQAQIAKNAKAFEENKKKYVQGPKDTANLDLVAKKLEEDNALALKKRLDKEVEYNVSNYNNQVKYNQLAIQLGEGKASKLNDANITIYNNEITYIKSILSSATLSYEQRLSYEEKLAAAVRARNEAEGNSSIAGGAKAAKSEIEQQLKDYKSIYTSTWNSINSTAENGIEKIVTGQEKISKGIHNIFNQIVQDFEKMLAQLIYKATIQDPLKDMFNTLLKGLSGKGEGTSTNSNGIISATGGGSDSSGYDGFLTSLLGNLLGGSSSDSIGDTGTALSSYASSFFGGAFADGGRAPSGWSLVGEKGAELINLSNPARVYNARETAEALKGASGSNGGGNTIILNIKTQDAQSFNQSRGQVLGGLASAFDIANRRNT